MNSTLKEQLQEVYDDVQVQATIPVLDGKYRLPDRRVLVKEGNKFVLVGHRDKKTQREISHWSRNKLQCLLTLECYGSHSEKKLEKLNKEELVRLFYPRPRQIFSELWLKSKAPSAQRLQDLVSKAVKI